MTKEIVQQANGGNTKASIAALNDALLKSNNRIQENIEERATSDLNGLRDGITMHTLNYLHRSTDIGGSLPRELAMDLTGQYLIENTDLLKQLGGIAPGMQNRISSNLTTLINQRAENSRSTTALERCSYISNKGFLMMMDLICTKRPSILLSNVSDFIHYDERTGVVTLNPHGYNPRAFVMNLTRLNDSIREFYAHDIFTQLTGFDIHESTIAQKHIALPERIDLGASPLDRKPRIGKKKALELLRQGIPSADIVAHYSGVTTRRLGAWKAHDTMGTYKT